MELSTKNNLKVLWVTCLIVNLFSFPVFANQFWQDSSEQAAKSSATSQTPQQLNVKGRNIRYVSFKHQEMHQALLNADKEYLFSVPTPDGKAISVTLLEDSVMAPTLASKFPEIRSFIAFDDNGRQIGRFSISHKGVRGMFRYNAGWAYLDPLFTNKTKEYVSYMRSDAIPLQSTSFNEDLSKSIAEKFNAKSQRLSSQSIVGTGDTLRTYRIAVAATGEYTQFHGGTVADGIAALNTMLNRVNQVYLVDLAVQFELVGNNDAIVYTDASTDPFNNNSNDIDRNQNVVDDAIGSANYDIGHVVTTSNGGVAALRSVCTDFKATGLTGLPSPTSDAFYIDYVSHEIGHQFGGNHSYNGTEGACGNRNGSTGWEPGSGSTIMAYAGLCGTQNLQTNSDALFHIGSITEMRDFIDNGQGGTCGTSSALTNNQPEVNAGSDYTIPANTPFTLTGSGTDPDSDSLLYVWEQFDIGTSSSSAETMVDNGNRPLFRTFNSVAEPSRTFPKMENVFSGTLVTGETYPTTTRTLNFRLTARDQNGGVASDSMRVSTVETGSQFNILLPSSNSWEAGRLSLLYWNTAGTNNAPFNCASVSLEATSDEGATFSTIETGIINDGLAVITAPISPGDIRFRLSCENNIFFTVSQNNISIVDATSVDTDGDGISDAEEELFGLNASDASDAGTDLDGDGLSNLEEVLLGSNVNQGDSDSDGIPDGYEVANFLNPSNASDAGEDADNDSVSNLEEYQLGSDPNDPNSNPYSQSHNYGFETSLELSKWSLFGDSSWELVSDTYSQGTTSIRSTTNEQNPVSSTTLLAVTNAGNISFDARLATVEAVDQFRVIVDGNVVMELSGVSDWQTYTFPVTAGAHVITWSYSKESSTSTVEDSVWIDNVNLPIDTRTFVADEVTNPVLGSYDFEHTLAMNSWDFGTGHMWLFDASTASSGNFSLSSADISDGQSSSVSFTGDFDAADNSFSFRTSTESGFDYLEFYVDGSLLQRWSGVNDFTTFSYPLTAGEHTLIWQYSKDGSVSSREDTVWIDDIVMILAVDTDNDGVSDSLDAFPNDPAASVDSDGDGYPDSWNLGYSESDTNSGLTLDEFPEDSQRWTTIDTDGDGITDDTETLLNMNINDASDVWQDDDGDRMPLFLERQEFLNTNLKDNDVFNNQRLLAQQAYVDMTRRFATESEIAEVIESLRNDLSPVDIYNSVLDEQSLSIIGLVGRIYQAVLNRTPDQGGLNYFRQRLQSGAMTNTDVVNSFINSQEFQSTYGSLSNTEFVNLVYQNVLGRAPDQDGLAYWVLQMDLGNTDQAGLMLGFIFSQEFVDREDLRQRLNGLSLALANATLSEANMSRYLVWINTEGHYRSVLREMLAGNGYREQLMDNMSDARADSDGDGRTDGFEFAEGFDVLARDNDVIDSDEQFVKQTLRDFIGHRNSMLDEAQQLLALQNMGSRSAWIDSLLQSTQVNQNRKVIIRLYNAILGRRSERDGLMFWIERYESGINTLEEIANAFISSNEFQATYGDLSNGDFVNLVYRNVLGREGDAGGVAYWTSQLDSNATSRGALMIGFSESQENAALTLNRDQVIVLFNMILRRDPSESELNNWRVNLETGTETASMIQHLLATEEYILSYFGEGGRADSDNDGVLDYADAYPNNAACSRDDQGNGTDCYATILAADSELLIENSGDNHVFFVSPETGMLIILDISNNSYREVSPSISEGEQVRVIEYSPSHNRLYLGYSSNRIAYLDINNFVTADFAVITERVDGLAQVGDYILAQDNSGSRESHYTFDADGNQTHWVDWTRYSRVYAWNEQLDRVYFFRDTSSPNDLMFEVVNQDNGEITSSGETPYHGDYSIRPPIIVSPDGQQVILGSGDIYNAETLVHEGNISSTFDYGVWSENDGLIVLEQQDSQFQITRFNEEFFVVEQNSNQGVVLDVISQSDKTVVLINQSNSLLLMDFVANDDTDGDGVDNLSDAFPDDIAASLDTDNDGAPDLWNTGYSQTDSTSGLILDAFPLDSGCTLESQGVNGACVPGNNLAFSEAISSTEYNGIIYVLSQQDNRINRWDIATATYLNPIILTNVQYYGHPMEIGINDNFGVLVGYSSGYVFSYSLSGLESGNRFVRMTSPIIKLKLSDNHAIVVSDLTNSSRDTISVFNSDGDLLDTVNTSASTNHYELNQNANRLFILGNSRTVIGFDIDESGLVTSNNGFYDFVANGFARFISVSSDESSIVSGNRYISSFFDAPYSSMIPSPAALEDTAVLEDFTWLSDIAIGHFRSNETSYIGVFSTDISNSIAAYELEHDVHNILTSDLGVTAVIQVQNGYDIVNIGVEGDEDNDGLPHWWEASHGFDISNGADAALDSDSDGLSNLQEYQILTDPLNSDTDGDGLTDGREVLELLLDPHSVDTDGDLLPDAWEVANGLNGNDSTDASIDSDSDGVSNYHEYLTGTDPQDAASLVPPTSSVFYSFEDNAIPSEWSITGDNNFSQTQAFDGNTSLASNDDFTISWEGLFSDVEIEFYLYSDCYSTYDKQYELILDGERQQSSYIEQSQWHKVELLVQGGFREISLEIDSRDSSCNVYIDAVTVRPMRSLFELGVNVVTNYDNSLYFYNYDSNLVRSVPIPRIFDTYARDIAVMDDGRIAVFNGTFRPVLSIYAPHQNSWEHITAPSWSTNSGSGYGGVDAKGNKVFVSNMSTSGNQTTGFVVFDLTDNSVEYVEGVDLIDLTVGLDGHLYGLTGSSVHRYDSNDYSLSSTVSIENSRSIAVNTDGDFFALSWLGIINQYNANGVLQSTVDVSDEAGFSDIAIRQNGSIVISDSWNNRVYTTNTSSLLLEEPTMRGRFIDFVPDIDTDSDGIPDWWEGAFGLNMDDGTDAAVDHDNDGLTALQEYQIGTKENNSDTDNDGVPDGEEHNSYNTNPIVADTDGDGLLDGEEQEQGTDPNNTDSDNDGLSDSAEVNTHNTNPLVADSDSDGMLDAYEIIHGLNANANDANDDPDGDALTNLQEHNVGSSPNMVDSDGDSLSDYDEVITHFTSPILKDTDGDKIPDNWELQFSLNALDASNASLDPDSDQFSTLEEYYASTNPGDTSDFPQPIVWQNNQGDERHSGYSPHILDTSNFSLKWVSDLPWDQLLPVTASDTQVFVSTGCCYGTQSVAALNSNTGAVDWQLDYEGINSVNAPSHDNGNVFFQTGGHGDSFIRSVDAATGELNFESSYGNQWSRYLAPTIYDGNVYMAGGYYGGVYGFDGTSGEQDWFANGPQVDGFTPAVNEGSVFAFTTRLDIIDRETGVLTNSIASPVSSGYTINKATVLSRDNNVVVSQNSSLVVFDTENLNIKWQRIGEGFGGQPSVANGTIYAIANGSLYSVDEQTGENNWIESSHNYNSNIIVTKHHIFVGDSQNTYAINIATQAIEWTYQATGELSLSRDGTLYISSDNLTAVTLH